MENNGYTYLCSPYSHADASIRFMRFQRAVAYTARRMLAGESMFSPIAHSHAIDLALPEIQGFDFWMKQDIPLLRHAARVKVLMLSGWEQSRGVRHELELALALHIPVEYVTDDE